MTEPGADPLRFSGVTCDACGKVFPEESLDEDGHCPECRPRMRRRMRIVPHVIAALVVVPFAVWVWRLEKGDFLPSYAWLIPLAAAYYLGLRIGREAVKGFARWRRQG